MEVRQKGSFSDAAGDLFKEIDQIHLLEEEKGFMEDRTSFTKTCDTILTIFCC